MRLQSILSSSWVFVLIGGAIDAQEFKLELAPPNPRSIPRPLPPLPAHPTGSSVGIGGNLVINGDFEDNAAGCNSNQSNANFNALVANATAYGGAMELDVYDYTGVGDCIYGSPPISGTTKVALHRQGATGPTDAFSLHLSAPVVAGQSYRLTFLAEVNTQFSPDVGDVVVGLSSSPISFGTEIFRATPMVFAWTVLQHDFVAPINAPFLTVEVSMLNSWIHVDAFSLTIGGPNAQLDIKPGSCPNSFNRGSNGVLPVALLGSDSLDAAEVDLATVRLSRSDGQGGSVAPHEGPPGPHSVVEDVATPFDGELCGCHELAGDGHADLSMKFRSQEVVSALQLGELSGGTTLELTLNGLLLDGSSFSARDCIRLVPPGGGQMLAVNSRVADAFIEASPPDELHEQGGFGSFVRSYPPGTVVRLEAPVEHAGWVFAGWTVTLGRQPLKVGGLSAGSGNPTHAVFVRSPVLELPILYAEQSVNALYLNANR